MAAVSVGVGHKTGTMPHRHHHGFGHTAKIGALIEMGEETVFVVDKHIVVLDKLFQFHGFDGIVAALTQKGEGKGTADEDFLGFRGHGFSFVLFEKSCDELAILLADIFR